MVEKISQEDAEVMPDEELLAAFGRLIEGIHEMVTERDLDGMRTYARVEEELRARGYKIQYRSSPDNPVARIEIAPPEA